MVRRGGTARATPCRTACRQSRRAERKTITTAVARRSVLARRAIRRRRRTKCSLDRAPAGDGERGRVDDGHRRHPARRPQVVPVAGVGLEVEAGGEEDDVEQHGEEPQAAAGASPGGRGRSPALDVRARLAVHRSLSIAAAHPTDPTNPNEGAVRLSPEVTAGWLIKTIPRRGPEAETGRGESPNRDTHSLSPFRPAPGERTPPLVSPPIPRARRRQSGAGRFFLSVR